MKKLSVIIAVLLCSMVFSISANADVPASFYVGKWSIKLAIPGGDKTMPIFVELKDGKLTGGVTDPATGEVKAPFTQVETTASNITVYFMMSGRNVYMTMEKKDENNIVGTMLDMFDSTGVRVEEDQPNVR
jgi:hypothetical protein